jgi:hypothetical protein
LLNRGSSNFLWYNNNKSMVLLLKQLVMSEEIPNGT